jgi:hypothetical protein
MVGVSIWAVVVDSPFVPRVGPVTVVADALPANAIMAAAATASSPRILMYFMCFLLDPDALGARVVFPVLSSFKSAA